MPSAATPKIKKAAKKNAVKQTVRRSKVEQRAESIEHMLDAAELLFSKSGLHGVTLKDVAKHVGVHTTLVNYYFQDKQSLFEAVFARRARVTSDVRMAALKAYEISAGDCPTVEGALHAFLDTDFDLYLQGGEGWMNYAAFCARASNTPEGADLMDRYFDPVVLKLVSILKQALPKYKDEDIFWGYHFVTGSLMNTLARTGRIDRLSGGLCNSSDFGAVKKRMARFMAAGFMSMATKDQVSKQKSPARRSSRAT